MRARDEGNLMAGQAHFREIMKHFIQQLVTKWFPVKKQQNFSNFHNRNKIAQYSARLRPSVFKFSVFKEKPDNKVSENISVFKS
jgi:hypothetical protein